MSIRQIMSAKPSVATCVATVPYSNSWPTVLRKYMEEHGLANKDIYIIDTNKDILLSMNNDAAQRLKLNAPLNSTSSPCSFICDFPETWRAPSFARELSLLSGESAEAKRLERRLVLHSLLWLQMVLRRLHAIRAPASVHSDWLGS